MTMTADERQAQNRAEQARLYGAPLSEVLNQLTAAFELSRGSLARILGLSAPMLSQLASGHRVKIGNPSAVHRLQRMMAALPDVRGGRTDPAEAIGSIQAEEPGQVLTRTTQLLVRRGAADVSQVLRSAASAAELLEAAALLQKRFPAIAEVLRIYGAGRADEAAAHFERAMPQ